MLNLGVALLRVEQKGNRSVVTEQYGKAPLQVHRPLYLDGQSFPTVYLRSPSSGLLNGDSHSLTIVVEDNASLVLRTQAACLVYPGFSIQTIKIRMGENSALMFLPHPLILAHDACFKQTIHVSVCESSRLLFGESWRTGRIAMSESWLFSEFDNTIEIVVGNSLAFREHFRLSPRQCDRQDAILLGGHTAVDTIYNFGAYDWRALGEHVFEIQNGSALERFTASVDASLNLQKQDDYDNKDLLVWKMTRPHGEITRILSRA